MRFEDYSKNASVKNNSDYFVDRRTNVAKTLFVESDSFLFVCRTIEDLNMRPVNHGRAFVALEGYLDYLMNNKAQQICLADLPVMQLKAAFTKI